MRTRHGLSQAEAARSVGVSREHFQGWEQGKYYCHSSYAQVLRLLARADEQAGRKLLDWLAEEERRVAAKVR
jgi:DNA-binding transcriptional regulator YiaG